MDKQELVIWEETYSSKPHYWHWWYWPLVWFWEWQNRRREKKMHKG